MFTTLEIVDLAVRIENNGEAVYRRAANEVTDLSLQSMLKRLADDEAEHAAWFSELKTRLPDGPASDEALQAMAKGILESILGDQSFSLQEADFSRMENLDQLIGTALEFEKDTVLFYEMIGAMVGERDTREHLMEIIQEEQRHVRQLEALLNPAG